MKWVGAIVGKLRPSIGGFPTFCEDPDALLQLPEVQEALTETGMTIQYWDGAPDRLQDWLHVPSQEKPLVIVESDCPKHLIESVLKNYLVESISISQIFNKFHSNVVKLLPKDHWEGLYSLHQLERPHRTPEETATLIARSFYGVDPLFLNYGNGWENLIRKLSQDGKVLPESIADSILSQVSLPEYLGHDDSLGVLTDPTVSRAKFDELAKTELSFAPYVLPLARPLKAAEEVLSGNYGPKTSSDWIAQWKGSSDSPSRVLEFGLNYSQACTDGKVSNEIRVAVNSEFLSWIRANYGYAMTSQNPNVLRLPQLVKRLDEEVGNSPMLLAVIDALGLESWFAIKETFKERIGYKSVSERGALAILPTLTTLSRRAIFEGKVPSQFGPESHSQDLERKLWKDRFGDDGGYFTPSDTIKLDHAFARKTKRVALVETIWDSMGHSIFPQADTVASAARRWAVATPITEIFKNALNQGYRVFITADHGQVAATGTGRLDVGVLSEQRSKRAVLFENDSLLGAHANKGVGDFQPYGLPPNLKVLFPLGLTSFDLAGVQSVSHGGPTIEESIVPVVELCR